MKSLHSHLENKSHVIWDWNGTLLRDIEHAVQVTNQLLREEGLNEVTLDHYRRIFRFPVKDYYKDIGFDTSHAAFLNLCERFNQHFHSGLHSCDLWPGVRETLIHVKSCNKIQSVLSASEQSLLSEQVRLFQLENFFDHVNGIADKAAGSKVQRGHELMRTVGIHPNETIMIGDTDHDLEVADALGIHAILVDHGHQHSDRLTAVHHTVLKIY